MAHHVSDEELMRCRNQLKSSLLMNLETRAITAEDIGRQVLALGKRLSVDQLIDRIGCLRERAEEELNGR